MRLRLLVSYHYHRDTDLAALVGELGGDVDLFADSGAYSAATTGATIHLADYAAWLRHWAPLLTVQSALDVIGDHEATAANVAPPSCATPGATRCPSSTSVSRGRFWKSCARRTGTSRSAAWHSTPWAARSNARSWHGWCAASASPSRTAPPSTASV
jgi:hypothetical protein